MLSKALNIYWQEHMENKQLYGHLPPVYTKEMSRRKQMADHCVRHHELSTNPLILCIMPWDPTHGSANSGRRRLTYSDMLRKDIGVT